MIVVAKKRGIVVSLRHCGFDQVRRDDLAGVCGARVTLRHGLEIVVAPHADQVRTPRLLTPPLDDLAVPGDLVERGGDTQTRTRRDVREENVLTPQVSEARGLAQCGVVDA